MILKKEILSPEVFTVALLHVLFFSLASFSIGQFSKPRDSEVSFLGPILDSFEIDRVEDQTTDIKIPSALSNPKGQASGNSFLPAKPRMSNDIKNKAKHVFKETILEEKSNPIKVAVPVIAEPEPKPYQKLRLYQ